MIKDKNGLSRGLGIILALSSITLLFACDPPIQFSSQTSPAAEGQIKAAASSDVAAAAIKLLPSSGSVVLIGGWSKTKKKPNTSTATAEFFNPATKKFSKLGSIPVSEGAGVAALLTSGVPHPEILVAGGFSGGSKFTHKTVSNKIVGTTINNAEIFDPATGNFTPATANLLAKRFGATATELSSGKVLIAGGADSTGTPLNSAEVFDPSTGATTPTANVMSSTRAFHSATLLDDDTVLLAGGGTDSTGDLTNTADIYDPETNKFTPVGNMGAPRVAHSAVLLTSGLPGKVLIVGGATGGGLGLFPSGSAEVYDPLLKTFNTLDSHMNDSRVFQSATVLDNGKVLIVGGFTNFFSTVNGGSGTMSSLFGSTLKSAELYDPIADTFTCVPGRGRGGQKCPAAMKVARAAHTATLFPGGALEGKVLIAGGLGAQQPNATSTELNEAELYDPTTNKFVKVGNLTVPRGLHAAVLIP